MPFVDPVTVHNPTAGTIAPAAWGDVVRDDLVFLSSPPRGTVSHNTTQSHTSTGNWLACSANTETKDTDSCHSTVTNNSRVTIVTAGDYLFEAELEWAGNATGIRGVKLLKNGTTDYLGQHGLTPNASLARNNVTALITGLVASDYIETHGFQSSGGNLNMQLIRFSWVYVGT